MAHEHQSARTHLVLRRLTARDARLSSFRFYDLLVHAFVVVLLISNLVGQKICAIPLGTWSGQPFSANISGAQLLFPITYIFGDIFTEVYGYGASRRAIWLGFGACTVLSLMGLFVVWIPGAPNWPNQKAFEAVFYTVPRFLVASLVAFWLGEFTNSYTLAKMKLWTEGKYLWTRTIGSTVAGQLVDTTVLILIAFGGRTPIGTMVNLMISGYVGKVLYETLATPLTYLVVNKLKRSEGLDVYDRDTDFNPFARSPAVETAVR
ncbi:MAG: queuosine precursor transporter [Chthoniobacterales bacterium]|nr:queuosine precursor transporter [Chthoniobacterales bacterium]MBA3761845.1 queuosine precursor transporter [Chthoniobacterales bacterium]